MTAVEWLINEMHKKEQGLIKTSYNHLFDKAKEMEKKQMFEYIKKHYVIGENTLKFHQEQFEKYYNETFKSE